MKRNFIDILGQLEHSNKQLNQLEENYKNKTKTATYRNGKEIHLNRIQFLLGRIQNIGCEGNLLHLSFNFRKDNKIWLGEMYLKDLEESNVLDLIKLLKKYEAILPDTVIVTNISLGSIIS